MMMVTFGYIFWFVTAIVVGVIILQETDNYFLMIGWNILWWVIWFFLISKVINA
jgi:hypothetical protein